MSEPKDVEGAGRAGFDEQRQRLLADMLPSQVWTARPDGTLDYVNRRVLDYFSRTYEQMLGEGWQNVVHPDDLPSCVERWIRSLGTGDPYDVDFRLRRGSDGAYRWHSGTARAVLGADGRIVQWLGTNTDFDDLWQSHRRLAEVAEARRASERRLRLALEAGRFGTWEWEVASGIVHWSEALEQMHGIPTGSFAGTFDAYQSDIHPADRELVLTTIRGNVETGSEHNLLYRIIRPDGELRWLEAQGRFELDERGAPQRLIGVCSDVTERVQSEAARTALAAEQAARREAEQAAARTQEILVAIADAFVVCGPDWRVAFINQAGARMFGSEPERVRGALLWELSPEVTGAAVERGLRQAMADRTVTTIENHIQARDEWREVTVYPLPDGGVAIYGRDITARKNQEALRARLTSYAALRAEVSAAVASGDDIDALMQSCCEAVMSHLPTAFVRIWLLDPSQQWLELRGSAGEYGHLDGAHRRVRVGELEIGRIAAERRPHLTSAVAGFPLLAGDELIGVLAGFAIAPLPEDTLGALATASDSIAHGVQRRRSELAIAERARELARSNADLEQFAYVASHDLQEPLRIIAGYNQLLARRYQGKLDADADEFIAFTVDGVRRMQRLITDLLTYSRVGTRRQELGPVAMEKVLEAALENLRQVIVDEKAEVTHDPLPEIAGDRGQLTQLLQNLVGNALKFHREGVPTVHVGARAAGAEWIFEVRDNGVGIEPQYFERIFVIFQRLHSTESYAGTGIGLALCKKIVERHGGRIWVESQLGQGSSFFFALPEPSPKT